MLTSFTYFFSFMYIFTSPHDVCYSQNNKWVSMRLFKSQKADQYCQHSCKEVPEAQ